MPDATLEAIQSRRSGSDELHQRTREGLAAGPGLVDAAGVEVVVPCRRSRREVNVPYGTPVTGPGSGRRVTGMTGVTGDLGLCRTGPPPLTGDTGNTATPQPCKGSAGLRGCIARLRSPRPPRTRAAAVTASGARGPLSPTSSPRGDRGCAT